MDKMLIGTSGRLFIGGRWVEAEGGKTFPTINPATGETIGYVADAAETDVDKAYTAAKAAFETWRHVPPQERGRLVSRLGRRVRDRALELAKIDTLEAGNPLEAMKRDVLNAANFLEYFGGLATELKGQTIPTDGKTFDFTVREPYGVVGVITAFNHPLLFAASRIAASVVAGNTVILKPSELTSLSALALAKEIEQIFPPGVINIVTGPGPTTGAAIASHPGVRRLFFTGGVEAGRAVNRAAAEDFKIVTLELGGKNPMIVFPDVDVTEAAEAAVASMNFRRSQGQSCGSTSRLFLHASLYEPFMEKLLDAVGRIKIGHPDDPNAEMGPLVSQAQYDKTMYYIRLGLEEGAELVYGGEHPEGEELARGFFIEPTVFTGVKASMRLAQEEIFGPVLSVLVWDDYDRMIHEVNDIRYGLTANIWCNSFAQAYETARHIDAGYIWINGYGRHFLGAPFGGFKWSGIGRQECFEELLSCTQIKNINVQLEAE